MEISGKIKVLNDTQNIGEKGFRKREVVLTTEEQYPQDILIEFIQDKCELLNNYRVGHEVKISLNLRGREWINPEGIIKYFNSIQGWRIEKLESQKEETTAKQEEPPSFLDEDDNLDLPF
jgi:translation initiation factor IF-3